MMTCYICNDEIMSGQELCGEGESVTSVKAVFDVTYITAIHM